MQHNTAVISTHPVSPHTGWANTSLNHRKFQKFKTEHHHFQSQEVHVSTPRQHRMGPGEGKAEAARDSGSTCFPGSPSAEDEPRHTANSRHCFRSHRREQEFSPPSGLSSCTKELKIEDTHFGESTSTNNSSFVAGRHWEKEGCRAEPLPSPSPPGPSSPVPLS